MKYLKTIKPTTSSQRGLKLLQKSFLSKKKPLKGKLIGLKNMAGRNHFGHITVRYKGGGHKKLYRNIDFARTDICGIVTALEYDPYRTAFIARVFNPESKKFAYILAPKNLYIGSYIRSGDLAELKIGHALAVRNMPLGSLLHNLSLNHNLKGQYARAAGTFVQLLQKTKNNARIRCASGKQCLVSLKSCATLGMVSNSYHNLCTLGKAGRSRWMNRRPHVRGVAMNPVDHPHGGGEGKTSGGRPSLTPGGKPTKGPKTSRSKNILV